MPNTYNKLTDEYLAIKYEFDKAEDYINKNDNNYCVAYWRRVLDSLNRNLNKF
jgi:urate oxidase